MTEAKTFLTPTEALARWGDRVFYGSRIVKAYSEFEEPEGRWRPQFGFFLNFVGYRLDWTDQLRGGPC